MNRKFKRYDGFTLAEVLITLGIIGIIAALTIPTLMQNSQDKAIVSSAQKAYTILSQAYISAVQENGTPDNWALGSTGGDTAGSAEILNKVLPYIKTTKTCVGDSSCWTKTYKNLDNITTWSDGTVSTASSSAILADGTLILTYTYGNGCSTSRGSTPALSAVCGEFFVDVNGNKNPNRLGVDVLLFYLTKNGMMPTGTALDSFLSFDKCTGGTNGRSCSAWVIYNQNLDYLKCPSQLSWAGQHQCS
jgi:prepilin-type N-terminal cleavage/methylation domain-containing protein